MALTSIADRLTPSAPIEITYGAQLTGSGTKMTTIIGHREGVLGSGLDYEAIDVVNVGDPDKARLEVEGYAGADSQLSQLAEAFVKTNSAAGRSTLPPFRIVLLPEAEAGFGPNDEALEAIKGLRSDIIVTPYPLGDTARLTKLNQTRALISGPDRDLTGQFGTFISVGTTSDLATAITELKAVNDRGIISAVLPDTNSASVSTTAKIVDESRVITEVASMAGINVGALVTGDGIDEDTYVESIRNGEITLTKPAIDNDAESTLSFGNQKSQDAATIATQQAALLASLPFPYRPVQGMEIGGAVQPKKKSDLIYADPLGASEQILKAGGSPFIVLPGGKVGALRARLNYTKLPDGVTEANAYIDFIDLAKLQDYKETMYSVLQNPPFNNNPGGSLLDKSLGDSLNDEAIRVYKDFQKRGAFQAASILTKQIVVQNSTTNRGTLEFRIPANAVPGAYVFKGNIVGVIDFDFYL